MIDNESVKPQPPTPERRKHRRHYVDLPADCFVIHNKGKGPIHVGIAENAGVGGLSVYLDQRIASGSQLMIELYYREDCRFTSLKTVAQVVWHSHERETLGFKHGLRLLKLETGGSPKLRSILKRGPILM